MIKREKMDIEKIKNANTIYIGKQIEYFDEVNSTHLYAKQIAQNEKNDGKIIIAERQSCGIGTNGRKWHTGNNKNIAMTIILKPKCKIEKLKNLTLQIAECIKQTIHELYKYNLEIKYPNDLLLNNKKISGILTQINTIGEKIEYLLISIGFNVNQEDFAQEITQNATSLKREYKKDFKREEIIIKFIEILEKEIEL